MIAATAVNSLMKPNDSLRRCLAACRRRTGNLNIDAFWRASTLGDWSLGAESSLLLVVGALSARNEVTAAATYMAMLLKSANIPTLWALKGSGSSTAQGSVTNLLSYLAMQALQLDPNAIGERVSASFNAALVASAQTEEDWSNILSVALSAFPLVSLIIDVEILGSTSRDRANLELLVRLLQTYFRRQSTTAIKVALLSHRKTQVGSLWKRLANGEQTHTVYLEKLLKSIPPSRSAGVTSKAVLRRKDAVRFQQRAARSVVASA